MHQPQSNAPSDRVPRGIKQTCGNETCGRRFYDLNRPAPACPYCETRCQATVAVRHEFALVARAQKGKFYRLEAPPAPVPEEEAVNQSQTTKDDELFSSPDVVMVVEDDDDERTDEILGRDKPEAG